MTLRETLKQTLEFDTALTALLTGGVYTGVEISRQNTPSAFDANLELKPCALLKMATDGPLAPHNFGARTFFSVMFYERDGYTNIEAAKDRVFDLLHHQKIGAGVWEIHHTDDVLDTRDDALAAALMVSRFEVIRLRG